MEKRAGSYSVRFLLLALLMLPAATVSAASLQNWLQQIAPDQSAALIRSYFGVLQAGQLLTLSETNSRTYFQIERQLNLRLQAGIGDPQTILDVRSRRIRAEQLHALDRQAQSQAHTSFRALTGGDPQALQLPERLQFSALPDNLERLLSDPRLAQSDSARREQISQLWHQRIAAEQRLEVIRQQLRLHTQQLTQVTQQFVAGEQGFIALVEAETALYSAKRARVKAHIAVLQGDYLLWQALGLRLRSEPLHPFDV